MMRVWTYLLGALFLSQLVLIAFMNVDRVDYRLAEAQEALVPMALDAVDRVDIDGGDTSVRLDRVSGQWQLPELDGFPADAARVDQLLTRLAELRRGWPVATTASAAVRFKVGDNAYERKISLRQGDQEVPALLLGSSPGFRKLHVRRAGEDEIYSVAFSAYEAGVRNDDWIDRTVLTVDENQVSGVRWPTFAVQRAGDGFRLQGLGEGESTAEEQIESLVRRLSELQIQAVVDSDAAANLPQESAVEIELTMTDGEALRYRFAKPTAEATYYHVKRSDYPYSFKIAEFDIKPLLEVKSADLVRSEGDETSQPANEVTEAGGALLEKDAGT
jgi:hypothetical protein